MRSEAVGRAAVNVVVGVLGAVRTGLVRPVKRVLETVVTAGEALRRLEPTGRGTPRRDTGIRARVPPGSLCCPGSFRPPLQSSNPPWAEGGAARADETGITEEVDDDVQRPFGQRNIGRALRSAQSKAVAPDGQPTFPVLHAVDEHGHPIPIAHGALPSMHSFRHTVASRALLAGESVDEIAFLLGHRDANVTRAVYVRELADARRRTMRRSRMLAEYSDVLGLAEADGDGRARE